MPMKRKIASARNRSLIAAIPFLVLCFQLIVCDVQAQSAKRSVSIWLIPAENAGPNDIAQGEQIPEQLEALRRSLVATGVRLLNVEDPLAMKARSWNPQFNVPNFQMVATQVNTIKTLQRFAREHNVDVVLRLVTWDEAFGLLSAGQTVGPDALPDVAQIGSTWAGYFVGQKGLVSRPNWQNKGGNWVDVLNFKACALPYATDVRLLFYWKRLPGASPSSAKLELNNSSWQALMESLRNGTTQGDTLVFPTGVTLNLLHDYFPLVRAGTGHPLLSIGPLGSSIDLTSPEALSVPRYLASQTHLPQSNGTPRRLISFPEASHQEAARTFVNGGYRATIEPANFITQWFHDFEERQDAAEKNDGPRRHFWDYAAALAPPSAFRGGSELVILNRAKDPNLAAELAEFLASDRGYTKVLAEAGHLPAGRPGYGINELIQSFQTEGDLNGASSFSNAVQKAIDQGVKYPDLEQWPSVFENHEVLESLQRVWRRMAEGDDAGMTRAARDLQGQINAQIYWPTQVKNLLLRIWPLMLSLVIFLALIAVWFRTRSLHRLATVLHLYRASRHESGKILGDNIRGLHQMARTGKLDCGQLIQKLGELVAHYTCPDSGLAAYMLSLSDDLVLQVQGVSGRGALDEIVARAFNGAQLFYKAKNNMEIPATTLIPSDLSEWRSEHKSAIATVILQEWFYNCIKQASLNDVSDAALITVEARRGAAIIHSPGHLEDAYVEILTSSPSRRRFPANASGLHIIRDLAYYAFGSKVSVSQSKNTIRLSIPMHLKKVKKQ
jgi:Bacterial extracellular solute-binding protein